MRKAIQPIKEIIDAILMRVLYVFVSIIIKKERGTWTCCNKKGLATPSGNNDEQAHAYIRHEHRPFNCVPDLITIKSNYDKIASFS